MALDITRVNSGDAIAVYLVGRLTLGPQLVRFGSQIAALFDGHRPPAFMLDIGGVQEADSAGLGELVILCYDSRRAQLSILPDTYSASNSALAGGYQAGGAAAAARGYPYRS